MPGRVRHDRNTMTQRRFDDVTAGEPLAPVHYPGSPE